MIASVSIAVAYQVGSKFGSVENATIGFHRSSKSPCLVYGSDAHCEGFCSSLQDALGDRDRSGASFAVMPLTGYLLTLVTGLPPKLQRSYSGWLLPWWRFVECDYLSGEGECGALGHVNRLYDFDVAIMTTLMMSLLAGRIVEVRFVEMMLSILLMVITPIAAGLIVNMILERYFTKSPKMESLLSIVSMIAICLICAIIAAGARSALANVGAVLICVVAAHNSIGYILGYWGARACRMNEADCRTVAIEVGLQNGGMAAGLGYQGIEELRDRVGCRHLRSLDERDWFYPRFVVATPLGRVNPSFRLASIPFNLLAERREPSVPHP